jgi:AcrR family transcriptional regulator
MPPFVTAQAARPAPSAETDGRRQRSERNRVAVVDALLELVREGHEQPSAAAVAERAGVSLRSVFRHFDDVDALVAAAVARHLDEIDPLLEIEVPTGRRGRPAPLDERISVLTRQRARLYEEIASVRVLAERRQSSSPPIAAGLDRVRRRQRRQVSAMFAPEIEGLDASARRRILGELDLVTSFAAWRQLRDEQGASVARAAEAMARLVRAVLTR